MYTIFSIMALYLWFDICKKVFKNLTNVNIVYIIVLLFILLPLYYDSY